MQGFNVAEAGHIVQVLPPVSISGGKTGRRFKMHHHGHVSILVMIGAIGAAVPTAMLVKVCKDANGTGATAIGFRYYKSNSNGQAVDQTSPPIVATSSGITTFDNAANQFFLIEIDSAEIDATGDASQTLDFPWIEWSITDSGNVTLVSVAAILSAARYGAQGAAQPTVTS
jgi:hypothetical protein